MKGENLLKTEILRVRVTPEEKHAAQQAASKDNRTVSAWTRLLIRAATGLNEGEADD